MSKQKNLKELLFSEKSIWDVLSTFESVFPRPITSKWLSIGSIVLVLIAFAGISSQTVVPIIPIKLLASMVEFGTQLSGSLLGVAIAGFSIFAGSMRPKILERLVYTDYVEGGPSSLSFIFASFIYILVALFGVLLTSFALLFFFLPESTFYEQVVLKLDADSREALYIVLASLFFGQMTYVFSCLISFIWNLHQILMVIAATEVSEN
jgi:hypothetical protein